MTALLTGLQLLRGAGTTSSIYDDAFSCSCSYFKNAATPRRGPRSRHALERYRPAGNESQRLPPAPAASSEKLAEDWCVQVACTICWGAHCAQPPRSPVASRSTSPRALWCGLCCVIPTRLTMHGPSPAGATVVRRVRHPAGRTDNNAPRGTRPATARAAGTRRPPAANGPGSNGGASTSRPQHRRTASPVWTNSDASSSAKTVYREGAVMPAAIRSELSKSTDGSSLSGGSWEGDSLNSTVRRTAAPPPGRSSRPAATQPPRHSPRKIVRTREVDTPMVKIPTFPYEHVSL